MCYADNSTKISKPRGSQGHLLLVDLFLICIQYICDSVCIMVLLTNNYCVKLFVI